MASLPFTDFRQILMFQQISLKKISELGQRTVKPKKWLEENVCIYMSLEGSKNRIRLFFHPCVGEEVFESPMSDIYSYVFVEN